MKKIQAYIEKLKTIDDWLPFLRQESGLPGPRGNLELIYAVCEIGEEKQFLDFITYAPEKAPVNTPDEFLACCGTVGLGRLVTEGKTQYLTTLRSFAADPRWRIREAVAMALQRYGESCMDSLLTEAELWSKGNPYEKRAAAAALCEPKLLKQKEQVLRVLRMLDDITYSIHGIKERKDEGFLALKKGMAYCWSVAIAACPDEGKSVFERWVDCKDKDIRWIICENLKKERLRRIDLKWVENCMIRLGLHN